MAKSARASTRKANNQRLKKTVYAPVEAARTERLSAMLRELAAQPKPKPKLREKDAEMEDAVPADDDGVPARIAASPDRDPAVQAKATGDSDCTAGPSACPPVEPPQRLTAALAMDIDAGAQLPPSRKGRGKKRIEKRRVKKSSIVFRKYKDRSASKKRK